MNARDLRCLAFEGDAATGSLRVLDQRLLPAIERWFECRSAGAVALAIRDMAVRGAPAIGIAAAYGVAIAVQEANRRGYPSIAVREAVEDTVNKLGATRPTAVNLFWALERCRTLAAQGADEASQFLELARAMHEDDAQGNRRIGETFASRIEDGMSLLTHCNAGALATGGYGTALAPIYVAHESGRRLHVYVDETRPRLQGARLTAWELSKVGVPFTLICDGMAASLMAKGKIQLAITGADRIAASGDVANKIGTYSVAVNAAHHQVPFHVAAPASTFDLSCPDGASIAIEERNPSEVTDWAGERTCPSGARVYNPSFDVTPARLVRSIVTERGEISPVHREQIAKVLGAPMDLAQPR
ncbi:MAG: S-methyl-5-thioribose-1-phosphate isomerase [Myxococcales bacterium]|nr:S-methyl-5-thioribose-1-phosphate isomerase [Myxococcales bacterium]